MSRESHKAIERVKKLGRMSMEEQRAYLASEKCASVLELEHAKSNDAHCLACGFQMVGGRHVGLCPKCGSDRWYRTTLTQNKD